MTKQLTRLLTVLVLVGLASSASSNTLYPIKLKSQKGSHSDQSLDVLAQLDQAGSDNDWDTYIEFSPTNKYVGFFSFRLPSQTNAADLITLTLHVNYLGPTKADQRWAWHLRNFCTKKWVLVGDNKNASDWLWTQMNFEIDDPSCYADGNGKLKLRYYTKSNDDSSDLDYLALSYTTDDTPGDWWQPTPGTSWQWQLSGSLDSSFDVDMYDIDLFDTSVATIDQLHDDGRVVICYFSAGSWEDWRDDADGFPDSVLGKTLDGWPDEKWLDIRELDILGPIMGARLDEAANKGCDGVEPDNVDGYANKSGFPLSYQDQLDYNIWLANAAHERGLSIGLKNDLDQIVDLVEHFDWALNEQCFQYDECELLLPFVQAGKAVFGVEYRGSVNSFCPQANAMDFDWLKKKLKLNAWREACR
ncbi:MAG: endo alpha-1,4 polygalactosaminidase [Pseudomonadota bacterium]